MKKFPALFFGLFLQAHAQSDLRCSQLSGNIYQLEWHGVQGRSYFIQASTDNMVTWDYLPDIRFGQEQTLRLGFEKIVDGMFLRLVYTDFPTTNPDVADFDGDGWTNLEEVVLYGTSPFDYDTAGPDSGGGQPGGGDPDVPLAQFELEVFTTIDGTPQTPTRLRLDSGFNTITDGGFYVDGGVPSISVSRSNEVVTEIKLIDLIGQNEGATLNYLQLQQDKHPTDPAQPDITSMVNGWSLTIPEAQGGAIPLPFDSFTLTGDLPPAEAGSTTDWLLKPMDITAVFGVGADFDTKGFLIQNLQALLDAEDPNLVGPDQVFNLGNIWGVLGVARRPDGQPNQITEKIWALEICEAEDPLQRALQSKERTVIFDGHSNFGLGPNFQKTAVKQIAEFTNFGVGYTNIPTDFHGIPGQMVQQNPDGSFPSNGPGDPGAEALDRVSLEGWAYVVLEPGPNPGDVSPEIMGNVLNYIPPTTLNPQPNVGLRFPGSGVGNQGTLSRQGVNPNFFHYGDTLIISAPDNDLPDKLGYRGFFYNSCDTGRDYIENFQHGEFLYTTRTCGVTEATWVFVESTIDGQNIETIKNLMNDTEGLGGPIENFDYYESYNFSN